MMRYESLSHEFVHFMPNELEGGVVYVSIPFRLALHRCCCGCGTEVSTPLGPTFWKLTFDGVSVSLSPSIGNRQLDCKSHYWITRNRVQLAILFPEVDRRVSSSAGTVSRGRTIGRIGQVVGSLLRKIRV